MRHPSATGGAEALYEGLARALRFGGHDVSTLPLAVDESTFAGILAGYQAAESLDVSAYDVVISTKAPTFAIRHPRHVSYLVHTIRVFYDMFDGWTDGSAGSRAQRDAIRERDAAAFAAIPEHRRFTIGEEVSKRLFDTLGFRSKALHPALPDAHLFHEGPFEHFLHVGRLHPWKRTRLALEGFKLSASKVPFVVAGTGEEEAALRALCADDPRIRFAGAVSRDELVDLYARALAVPFAPTREDFGYVAVEAMLSGKPVITASDAGEPARIVTHQKTGLVLPPSPEAFASAYDLFAGDRDLARRYGQEGLAAARRIAWPGVVAELLRAAKAEAPARSKPRVLVVDNQPIDPPVGGGRLRLWGVFAHLPDDLDPVYVGTYDWRGPAYRGVLHEGRLLEITVPQSEEHFRAHEALAETEPALSIDVTFPLLGALSPALRDRIRVEAEQADAIVVSHPWVYPLVSGLPAARHRPLVYDAHNVEGRLRRTLLPAHGLGLRTAEQVEALERELCTRADLILACSPEDATLFEADYGVPRSKIQIVPNGVDAKAIRPPSEEERQVAGSSLGLPPSASVAVFVGSRYGPNVDAARFICRELAPRLPSVTFLLVGGCSLDVPPGEIGPNVKALGPVDDATRNAAYRAADVALNPMTRGSGTNIKMLDYFAAGLPAVSTDVGARGLGIGSGTAYHVEPLERFAEVVARLLEDGAAAAAERARMSVAARALAVGVFDWKLIGESAGSHLAKLFPGRAGLGTGPRRPRLALLSSWATACGIADYTSFLAHALPRGVDWKIYAEARGSGAPDGPRVSNNWEIGLWDLAKLENSLSMDAADLLLAQHNPAFYDEAAMVRLLDLGRARGVPVAFTLHAARGLSLSPELAKKLDEGAARIVVHREADARWLAERGVKRPVRVFPQGIPRLPERSMASVRAKLGLSPTALLTGHFGYLRPHKGALELLEAFEFLAPRVPEAELLLLSAEYPSEDSRAHRALCERRIAASPFRARIHASFDHQPLEGAGYLLQACDLIAFPYGPSKESSSAAVRLALAARRPILVSASEIFQELEGVAAVAPSIEPESLALSIERLLRDRPARDAILARVRTFSAEREWERVAARIWGDLATLSPSA